MPLDKELKKVGRSVGAMLDGRGRHNFVPYELESGMVIVCSYCGWKKDDCKNKKNCSGNPDGPYAKLLHGSPTLRTTSSRSLSQDDSPTASEDNPLLSLVRALVQHAELPDHEDLEDHHLLQATQNSSQVLPLATPTPTNASSHSCCLPKNSNTVKKAPESRSTPLTVNELAIVQNVAWEGRARWYNIGLELGLTPGTLDTINLANRGEPDGCFRMTLKEWLSTPELHPSWHSLANSLRAPPVGLAHLAEQLHIYK